VHDCGPMGNDCHLDSGAMAEGPLTTATPKVRADALGLSVPRSYVSDPLGITGRGRARMSVARGGMCFCPRRACSLSAIRRWSTYWHGLNRSAYGR
jgi:hypothetical protein